MYVRMYVVLKSATSFIIGLRACSCVTWDKNIISKVQINVHSEICVSTFRQLWQKKSNDKIHWLLTLNSLKTFSFCVEREIVSKVTMLLLVHASHVQRDRSQSSYFSSCRCISVFNSLLLSLSHVNSAGVTQSMLETVVPRNTEAHIMLVGGKRKGQVSVTYSECSISIFKKCQ